MILKEDLDIVANSVKDNGFKNSLIMVTGSTGLIGSLIVKGFLEANYKYKLNNKIYALSRNISKAKNVFNEYSNDNNLFLVQNDIVNPINVNEQIDYIFHTACITKSSEMILNPVELIKISIYGTNNVLEFAKKNNVKSVVYLSSMEVYGVIDECKYKLKEHDLGKIDLTLVRNCYPESKRLNENLCKCYAEEYKLNVCVARLTQTFGAGVSNDDNRIFAYISKCIMNNENIVLKSSGKSTHDYCYTTDAISAILLLSKKGERGEVYNIANEDTNASIFDMAMLIKDNFNKNIAVKIEMSDNEMYSKDSIIKLDTNKIRKLGWEPKINLIQMYQRLIQSYKEYIIKKE